MIKCVVPISGGKDSQACMKLAIEMFARDEIVGLFCDTKFEHPLTYQHIETIRQLYGVNIETVSDGDVITRCLRYGRFPSGVARFCTDDLKIKPTKRFLENLAAKQGQGFEVWYGMRQNESHERAVRYRDKIDTELYAPHEVLPNKYPAHLATMGVRFRLPIVDLTDGEVVDLVGWKNLNPLYFGTDKINIDAIDCPPFKFKRVGCFPCLAGGDESKDAAFKHDETGAQHFALVKTVEERTGKTIWTSKHGKSKYEDQGCLICSI
jgi:3'-phosphoadenosine 5'-phosphosulfate sulfotransferase (PAPS reductase)/FAD synthetase